MNPHVHLIRPAHFIKNVLVFFPLFFSGNLFSLPIFLQNLAAFTSFSLMAGAVYIFNDLNDYKSDREHPQKRTRPVASGKVSIRSAAVMMVCTALLSLALALKESVSLLFLLLLYLFLNILYSASLKQYTLPALLILSSGYLLRVGAGAHASEVELSSWILILTFLLATLIGIHKRRDDNNRSTKHKPNITWVHQVLSLSLSAAILFIYILWSLSPLVQERLGSDRLWISSLFVCAALLRYNYVILVNRPRRNPVKLLLHDPALLGISTAWGITLFILLYS